MPLFTIALLSAAVLSYEILLMRLFSIIQWHHFAYMIISLALLGFGMSGTFVALLQKQLLKRFPLVFELNIILFAMASVGGFLLAQRIPFNPEEILWNPRQFWQLLVVYLLLSLPFFFAANAIALALTRFHEQLQRLYAYDLVGAGIGSLGIIGLLFLASPLQALVMVGCLGLVAAGVAIQELSLPRKPVWLLILVVVAAGLVTVGLRSDLHLSPYKELSQTLRIAGTKVVNELSSPLGYLSVLESPTIPLRHAPGLSLNATGEPPPQVGIFTDGGSMSAITMATGQADDYAYLDKVTSAAVYHLLQPEQVLVLGAGGGDTILQARYHQSAQIDAVELNPQLTSLLRMDYADFTGQLLQDEAVTLHTGEARGYVTGTDKHYDLIQVALLDSFAASSAGLYALNESYLYTVEALQAMLDKLKPGGYLAVTRWIKLPPRDTLKLFATAVAALEQSGSENPGQQLLLLRSWQTGTLLIKNGEVSDEEIAVLKQFTRERSFDLAWYPGITADEVNRYNRLSEPFFYNAAHALLEPKQRENFYRQYKFDLTPATDDRPYFFHFFKWSVLPEILRLRTQGGLPLLEGGYLVLVATMLQAIVVSVVLILLPLIVLRRYQSSSQGMGKTRVLVYFTAVGLAFLFIEMAFIQKFILFLHHPLYAVAVVLTAFLVFAGLGSGFSYRLTRKKQTRTAIVLAISGIAVLGCLYLWLLDPLFHHLMSLPAMLKIPLSMVLIAPLAFCMGMPFPLALSSVGKTAPEMIPWAWGVNGCASVVSAVLATLLAIHFGFTVVVIAALVLYGIAWASFPHSAD